MKKIITWGLLIVLLISANKGSIAEVEYASYENKFDLSGKLIQKDAQEFPLNGELEILASNNGTFLNYGLNYFALIPSLFDSYGSASYSENISSKDLVQKELNSTALSVVWTIFTNDIENVQSIFRISQAEVNSGHVSLLNYTNIGLESRSFSSPQLAMEINSYYVVLDLPDIKYQIFYDAKNLVILGLNVFLTRESLNYDFDISLRVDIKSTTLTLDKIGDIDELNMLLYIGGGMIGLLIIGFGMFIYLRKSRSIVSGGL